MLPSDSHQLTIALVALIGVVTSLLSLWLTRLQTGRVEEVARKIDQAVNGKQYPPFPSPPPGGIHPNLPPLPDETNPLAPLASH